jgi:hypothetical protein
MSQGRKKKEPKIDAPPAVTTTVYTNPLGDQFTSVTSGGAESHSSRLSSGTQAMADESSNALQSLAKELNMPDERRLQAIGDRSRDYYDLQAGGINQDVDDILSRTKSDLNKRFGGAYNATFGTSLLGDIESNRVDRLVDARKESALLGEDLYQQDEDSRIRRFTLFQNYLNDLNNQARGLQSSNAAILANERGRATDVAVDRANLAYRYAELDQRTRDAQAERDRRDRDTYARMVSRASLGIW